MRRVLRGLSSCVVVLTALGVAACAPSMQTSRDRRVDREENYQENLAAMQLLQAENGDQREVPILPLTVLTPQPEGDRDISRSVLEAYLEGGPHQLLLAVEVSPVMDQEAFRGYRVDSLDIHNSPLEDCSLRIGDVIVAVNGRSISRPETFMEIWESLGEAETLEVELVRAGAPQILAWNIQ